MKVRPKNNSVLIELEPIKETTKSGIIKVGPEPVRIAKVLEAGPGKWYGKRFVPTMVKPGDRFPFFTANLETKSGRMVSERLPEDQKLIKDTDILFVIDEGDPEITV